MLTVALENLFTAAEARGATETRHAENRLKELADALEDLLTAVGARGADRGSLKTCSRPPSEARSRRPRPAAPTQTRHDESQLAELAGALEDLLAAAEARGGCRDGRHAKGWLTAALEKLLAAAEARGSYRDAAR